MSSKFVKCFSKTDYTSLDDIKDDLNCPNQTVCNTNTGICETLPEQEITEIKINNETIPVSGKDDIIERIKQKIRFWLGV